MLVLNVAVALVRKEIQREGVSALPGFVVRLCPEGLHVLGASGEGKHGNRLAHPNAVCLEAILACLNCDWIISRGLDEVRLYPGDELARIEQQVAKAGGGE